MQALLLKKPSKWREIVYTCFSGKNPEISEPIAHSDAENRKKQTKYAVSRMHLKNYNICC